MPRQAPNSPEKPSRHDAGNATPDGAGMLRLVPDGTVPHGTMSSMRKQLGRVPTGGWMVAFAVLFAFAALIWTDSSGDWSFSNWWVEAGPAATAFCTAVAARLGHRPAGAIVAWTLFAPVVWALCLAPALVVLALIVGLLYGHGIN